MDNPAPPQPIQPPEPQMQKPIEKPMEKQKKSNPTTIFLSVLLIISVALTLLFYYQNQKLREMLSKYEPEQTPQASTSSVPVEKVDTSNWKEYKNEKYGFSLKQPDLDSSCCKLEGPASGEEIEKLVTFADKSTVSTESATFDGFSIHVATVKRTTDIAEYIEEEKQALTDQYVEKNGKQPEKAGITTVTSVDGKDTIVLKNYAWDGNERYYFQIPNFKIMVITKSEKEEGSFSSIFETMLSTFKFEIKSEEKT